MGKRAYGGMEDCELNLYDKNFEFVKEIGDLKIKSGIYIGYPFFMYRPSEILYYRYFYNNIYAIDDKQNVSVKYYIDFGENNMPFDLSWRDEYDCIDFINSSEEDYAILVSNIYESDKYFCFRFLWKKKSVWGFMTNQMVKQHHLCLILPLRILLLMCMLLMIRFCW